MVTAQESFPFSKHISFGHFSIWLVFFFLNQFADLFTESGQNSLTYVLQIISLTLSLNIVYIFIIYNNFVAVNFINPFLFAILWVA